jgi:hypothetical protein
MASFVPVNDRAFDGLHAEALASLEGERTHHPLLLAVGAQGHDPRRRHLTVQTL